MIKHQVFGILILIIAKIKRCNDMAHVYSSGKYKDTLIFLGSRMVKHNISAGKTMFKQTSHEYVHFCLNSLYLVAVTDTMDIYVYPMRSNIFLCNPQRLTNVVRSPSVQVNNAGCIVVSSYLTPDTTYVYHADRQIQRIERSVQAPEIICL